MTKRTLFWNRDELHELIPKNIRGLKMMFTSLRSRNFRLYFIGQCIAQCGTWIQSIAMSWLVYRLTGSIVLLTVVAFINQAPYLLLTPFTGVLSDRKNRWKILKWTQSLFMLNAAVLALLTLGGWIVPWHLMVLSGISGVVAAFDAPARQSFYSDIVPKEDLANAVALNSLTINGGRFVGPAIGGLMIAAVGEGYCFLINAVCFMAVVWALMAMRMSPFHAKRAGKKVLEQLREGVSYIRGFLPIKTVIFYVASLSFFGLPFLSITPALVKDVLGGDSRMLGYFNSCLGLGTMSAALYLAARKKVTGLGKVATINSAMFGISLILIAFIHNKIVACVVGIPLGFAMIGTMATANILLQTMVDNDIRGRVMSFFNMAYYGMSPVGALAYGFFAKVSSLQTVLLASGAACLVTCVLYEYYRPQVRTAAHERHLSRMKKEGVVEEFATAIDIENNPF